MPSDNLSTASLYINNLLQSRGLLRNGLAIDFARPDLSEEGLESTMGRVMSLINDLILRRDRDANQRETLTTSIRTLKAEAHQQTNLQARQNEKLVEVTRKLGLNEGVERSLNMRLKAAETAGKAVKDELARLRLLLDQTRSSCALEVRKRESVIKELRKRIEDGRRVRGSGKPAAEDLQSETNEFLTKMASGLREENEKLSALVKATFQSLQALSGYEGLGLRDLNVSLRKVEFDLMSNEMENVIEHLRRLLTNPSFVPIEEVEIRETEIRRLREGWERMEGRWRDAIIMMDGWKKRMEDGGREVGIEELTRGLKLSPIKKDGMRDEADGLSEKDVLMRSLSTIQDEDEEDEEGATQADIDAMDDSQVPLASGDDDQMESKHFQEDEAQHASDEDEDDENELFSEDDNALYDAGSITTNTASSHSLHDTETAQLETQDITFTSITSGGSPPQLSPLRSINANINTQDNLNHRNHDAFTTIVEENTWDLAQLDDRHSRSQNDENKPPIQPQDFNTPEFDLFKSPLKQSNTSSHTHIKSPSRSIHKGPLFNLSTSSSSSKTTHLPQPQSASPSFNQQSPITTKTIAAKLAATKREADTARVRAKLKAAKLSKAATNGALTITPDLLLRPSPGRTAVKTVSRTEQHGMDSRRNDGIVEPNRSDVYDEPIHPRGDSEKPTEQTDQQPETTNRKRKGTKSHQSRTNRRRSTLSPWEMEVLIKGDEALGV